MKNADLIDAAIARVNVIATLADSGVLPADVRVDVSYEGFGTGCFPNVPPAAALRYLNDLRHDYVPYHRFGAHIKVITLSVRVPDIHIA